MKYLIVIIALFLMGFSIEAEKSITKIKYRTVTLISITDIKCSFICYGKGFHIGKMDHYKFNNWGIGNYKFAGLDLYIKIKKDWLFHRWGLGLSKFDKQDKHLDTPWDFHLSLESGISLDKFNFIAGIHHWSNGRGFVERLGLEKYWLSNNSGFDAFTLGVSYEW